MQAVEASEHDLRVVHTSCYLASLHCPCRVARLVEVAIVAFLPSFVIDKYLLKPFRYHTGRITGMIILDCRLFLLMHL